MKLKEQRLLIRQILKTSFKSLQLFKDAFLCSVLGGGVFLLVGVLLINKIILPHKEQRPIIKMPCVEVVQSTAQTIKPLLTLSAETKANAIVAVCSEISGKVTDITVDKGQEVSNQQPLLKIIDNDRVARLDQGRATVEHRLAEYKSATKLKSKDIIAENSFLQSKVNLETAKAELARVQYEHDQLIVKSPIPGYYQDRVVEVGSYVDVGDKLATIVDLSTLHLVVFVSEKDISSIKVGQTGKVTIDSFKAQVGKAQAEAKVIYISKVADPKTHTYLVELTMDNRQLLLPEGLTAKVDLEKDAEQVHTVSPSVLILDDQGTIGVMTVDKDNKAVFKPVEVLQASAEKISIRGLPDTVIIISSGAEFIKNGHTVEPIFSNTGNAVA